MKQVRRLSLSLKDLRNLATDLTKSFHPPARTFLATCEDALLEEITGRSEVETVISFEWDEEVPKT